MIAILPMSLWAVKVGAPAMAMPIAGFLFVCAMLMIEFAIVNTKITAKFATQRSNTG